MENKILYREAQDYIGYEFNYETDTELRSNLSGLVNDLINFICEYNLQEECVEHLNDTSNYYLGDDFRATIVDDIDEWLRDVYDKPNHIL